MTDIPTFKDAPVPDADIAPETEGLFCEECGDPIHYAGRGRKPKFCDKHRKTSGGTSSKRSSSGNEKLAASATDALINLNGLVAFGLQMSKMPTTADTIRDARDEFRTQVYEALLLDPGLCRQIMRGGIQSGRVSLIIAYAMLGSIVIPTATLEWRMNHPKGGENEDRAENAGTTVPFGA